MSKLFALDYGRARIGIASCSTLLKIPTPYMTFKMLPKKQESIKALALILKKENPLKIIVGLPLELSGKEGIMAQEAREFANLLQTELSSVPFVFIDERLTSAQAEKAMIGLDFNRKKRAESSDTMAACIILESFIQKEGI